MCLGALCVTSHGIYVLSVSPTSFPWAQNKNNNHFTNTSINTNAPRSGSRGARGMRQPPSRSAVGPVEPDDEVAVRRDVLLFVYTYVCPFTELVELLT